MLVIDGKGNQTWSEYNLDGRLSRVTNANNETIDYTYYPGRQLETLTDANGHTTFYKVTSNIRRTYSER